MVLHAESVDRGVDLDLVVKHPVGDLDTGEHHVVVGHLHDTLHAPVLEGGDIVGLLGASLEVDVVDLGDRGTGDLVQPVDGSAIIVETDMALPKLAVLGGRHVLRSPGDLLGGSIGVDINSRRQLALDILGGDDDNAVCAAGTVDSRRGTILKHVYGLDIVRGDLVKASWDTVDQHERSGAGLEGRGSTKRDLGAGDRVAVRIVDDQAGNLTLDKVGGVGARGLDKVLFLDGGDGTGHLCLLHGTVTDSDGFLKKG